MKRLNKFSRLPQEDQTLILNLCEKLPYKAVVEQIARPRSEGGLDFTTCVSALCKFNTHHHPDVVATEAIGQYSAAIQINHQAHGEANFEAILSLVQTRILTALRAGKSVADLDREFRNLQRVQKCFLADVKYRDQNDHVSDAYLGHIRKLLPWKEAPDFIRNDLENDSGADIYAPEDFHDDLTQLELDLEFAENLSPNEIDTHPTFMRGAARVLAALTMAKREQAYIARRNGGKPSISPNQLDAVENANPADLLKILQHSDKHSGNSRESIASKPPVISTISNNFHSPETKGGAQ
jgi:hypothetical protein